ncbi:hypothetical protein KA517_00850 [Candidatus Gracilibacteria bacterium]|nr:hypothetical protein [Candidatus Gracilibacteria bacterium]
MALEGMDRKPAMGPNDRAVLKALADMHEVHVFRDTLAEIEERHRVLTRESIVAALPSGAERDRKKVVMGPRDGARLASLVDIHGIKKVRTTVDDIAYEAEIASRIHAMYVTEVEKAAIEINAQLNGKATSVSIWEVVRLRFADGSRHELSKMIHDTKSATPAIAKFIVGVKGDLFDSPGGGEKPHDRTDVDFLKGTLTKQLALDGSRLAGEELVEVQAALKIAALNAQYKFASWRGDQMLSVLSAYEQLVSVNDRFDPDQAGYPQLKEVVIYSLASIKCDFESKPNYPAAAPEFSADRRRLSEMLITIGRIDAKLVLRDARLLLK